MKNDLNENEDLFEEKFFNDDKNKNKIRLIISICAMAMMVVILLVVLLINNKSQKETTNLQDNIVEYAQEKHEETSGRVETEEISTEEINSQIIERDEIGEIEATPTPTPTPENLPTPTPEAPIMETNVKNYSKIKYDAKVNLKEMESYFAEGNYEAIYDLSHLDRFIAMSYAYRDTTDFAYYGDVDANGRPNGKGIAVYADNQYYYGDWVDGEREGEGLWIHYHIHLKENLTDTITFHQYQGQFKNDLPEGQGQDHYEYDSLLLTDGSLYFTNYMGTFKDGLVYGAMYMTATDKNENYYEYEGNATEEGSFDQISESVDKKKRSPVLVDKNNPDSYYWLTKADNRNIGVKSYISHNKK